MADEQKFKCIVGDYGIVVGLNKNIDFTYSNATHFITDLGDNIVRITRKVNTDYHVIYDAHISRFVDVNGNPVAKNIDGFRTYFSQQKMKVSGGRGIVVNDQNKVILLPGTSLTVGGFMVGSGLEVDLQGRLSATAHSEITMVLDSESAMLALPVQEFRPYRVVRTDTNTVWYLNAGDDPSNLSNWLAGPSTQSMVLSFKGRVGVVDPESGDYTLDMVGSTDKTSGILYHLETDGGKLYVVSKAGDEKYEVAYQSTVSEVKSDLQTLKDTVQGGYDSIEQRVSRVETTTDSNNAAINKQGGILTRVDSLESKSSSYMLKTARGTANGVAPLNENKKIPQEYLPNTRIVVNGEITSTKPLTMDCGNIRFSLDWTNSGEIKCSAMAISGSQVADLRSSSLWGGGGVDSYSLDGVTFTQTPNRFDSVYYTKTSECTFWRLRENGRVWEAKIFVSGGGSRATMWADLIFDPANV